MTPSISFIRPSAPARRASSKPSDICRLLALAAAAAATLLPSFNAQAVGLVASSSIVGGTAWSVDSGQTWTASRFFYGSQEINSDLRAISFISGNQGWGIAASGNTYQTTDGGVNWHAQGVAASLNSSGSTAVQFVDANHGWAGNANGGVFRTIDGGATWTAVANSPFAVTDDVRTIDFVNANEGWLTTRSGLYHSTDGGVTWARQLINSASGLYMMDATHGVVVNLFAKYTVNGSSWTTISPNFSASDFSFVDGQTGWAMNATQVRKTTNGGRTWSTAVAAGSGLTDIVFADANEGWVVGSAGVLRHSTDGGATWTTQSNVLGGALTDVALASPTPAPVPEPETYAMLLAGLGVLGAVARRRKSATRTLAA